MNENARRAEIEPNNDFIEEHLIKRIPLLAYAHLESNKPNRSTTDIFTAERYLS